MIGVNESMVWNWQVWMQIPPFDEVEDNLAVRLLSNSVEDLDSKDDEVCSYCFLHDFHRFFEVVAILLVICYTKQILIFENPGKYSGVSENSTPPAIQPPTVGLARPKELANYAVHDLHLSLARKNPVI